MHITGSTNIYELDFSVNYDISDLVPIVNVLNLSTGPDMGPLKWWLVITSPSGYIIHAGSVTSPDFTAPWTDYATPSGAWPMPIDNQIEWGAGYSVTLYTSLGGGGDTVYSLTKTTTIIRPAGNKENCANCHEFIKGTNYGWADVSITARCTEAALYAEDITNYSYQGVFGEVISKLYVLDYPMDSTATRPAPFRQSSFTNALIPIAYGGPGFTSFLTTVMKYEFDNSTAVTIKYKNKRTFPVYCTLDLGPLLCDYRRMITDVKEGNGDQDKLNMVTSLMMEAMIMSLKPNCNDDLGKLIDQIKKVGGFTCNCYSGVNTSIPISGTGTGKCCPVTVVITDITGPDPIECVDSVYPVNVFGPDQTTQIGIANTPADVVNVMNNNSDWLALGTAFQEGNCQVGFYPVNVGATIPAVYIKTSVTSTGCVGNTQTYSVKIVDICFPNIPIVNSMLPMNAYVDFGAGQQGLGQIVSQADLVVKLNAAAGKPASITFSAGTLGLSQINIFNSDCSGYSTPITIFTDAASTEFIAYGASHGDQVSFGNAPAMVGYGVKGAAVIGHTPSFPINSSRPWHTIYLPQSKALLMADITGFIYWWDMANPIQPVFVKKVALNVVVSGGIGNFTAAPATKNVYGATGPSRYSLYFPTDEYSMMTLSTVYVFESTTGTAWHIDMTQPSDALANVAAFQDDSLIGKCPRVLKGGTPSGSTYVFFTQDGSIEAELIAGGVAPSGVPAGNIVKLDVANFNSTGILQSVIFGVAQEVWAAAFDGTDSIYFVGKDSSLATGDVAVFSISTFTITHTYSVAMGGAAVLAIRGNAKFYGSQLYVSSAGAFGLGASSVMSIKFFPSLSNHIFQGNPANIDAGYHVHSVQPLGNCLMLVTGEGSSSPTKTGSIAVYKTNGIFVSNIDLPFANNIYNLITIGGVSDYTGTTLIP